MRCRSAFLVALLSLTGIVDAQAALFDPSYRVILPAARARLLLAPSCAPLPAHLLEQVSGVWTPAKQDIDALEDRLPAALKAAIAQTHWIGPESATVLRQWESIANHARQYAGLMIENRKRILLIAAPIRHVDSDGPHLDSEVQASAWRYGRPLGVCNGDTGQFSAQYDHATGQFADFTFGGAKAADRAP
jgi:hypothetical protein